MKTTRLVATVVAGAVLLVGCTGGLDRSFGNNGIAVVDFGGTDDVHSTVLRDAEGRYLTVGSQVFSEKGAIEIARLLPDGSLDRSFSGDGKLKIRYRNLGTLGPAAALQPDGRILVAGGVSDLGMAVLRLDPTGDPDPTFGDHGWAITKIGALSAIASGVAVQSDGRIVATGFLNRPATNSQDFALIRLLPDGTPDTSFGGTDGELTTDMGGHDMSGPVLVDHHGRIVVVGRRIDPSFDPRSTRVAIARYRPNGALDPTFGDGGRVTTVTGSWWDAVLTPKDRILVSGSIRSDTEIGEAPILARFNTDGSLDTRFGFWGVQVSNFGPPIINTFGLALQADGKAVVAGAVADTITGLDQDAVVMRFTTTGPPDLEFGTRGLARFDLGAESGAFGILEQPNGKLAVVGTRGGQGAIDVFVMRVLGGPRRP